MLCDHAYFNVFSPLPPVSAAVNFELIFTVVEPAGIVYVPPFVPYVIVGTVTSFLIVIFDIADSTLLLSTALNLISPSLSTLNVIVPTLSVVVKLVVVHDSPPSSLHLYLLIPAPTLSDFNSTYTF